MKPTELVPLPGARMPGDIKPDRLTQFLLWATFFLVAGVVALATDLWLWPSSDGVVAQAVEPTKLQATPTVTLTATLIPEPTSSPTDAPTPTAVQPTLALPSPTATEEATPSATASPAACIPPDDWGLHVVQPGNTLASLAKRYGTDPDTLMLVNCLNTGTIFVNQRLYVPGRATSSTLSSWTATQPPSAADASLPTAPATPGKNTVAVATPAPSATPKTRFQLDIPDDYLNIVLLGSDKRPTSGAWRTDSMIVVSVDMKNNVVRLLSIPRDLWVDIPGHGYNRVNTAELWGELAKKGTGPERVKQTIYQNLGIPIHYYVRVDFQGFMKIIDAVGGVDIDVDCPLPDIKLTAGMHHMNGQEALRYARSRKSTNDFDRGRRQRKVLMALWDQALTMNIIPKLPELWRTMSDSFQTDLPLNEVINLAYVGVQLKPQHIMSSAIGSSLVQGWVTPQGASVLLPREDKIRAALEKFYAHVEQNSLDTADKVRVEVINGSQRKEAEELAAAALRWEGFKVVSTSTAAHRDYGKTTITIYDGDADAADEVASGLNVSSAIIQDQAAASEQPTPSGAVDIQVILGGDYNPCQR